MPPAAQNRRDEGTYWLGSYFVEEPDQNSIRTYYHEAGHAIGAVIRSGGYVRYLQMDMSLIVETGTRVETSADEAFMSWAGPWAQACWEENCTEERIKELFQTQSWYDWPVYEKARDSAAAAAINIDGAAAAAELADLQGRPKPDGLPPVTPPEPDWDCELRKAWPEIKRLADSMLNGESPIDLSNGQQLRLDETRDYDHWWDPTSPWSHLEAGDSAG